MQHEINSLFSCSLKKQSNALVSSLSSADVATNLPSRYASPPTIDDKGIMFSGRPSGCPSINTYFSWHVLFSYSGGETCHKYLSCEWELPRIREKVFKVRGQRARSYCAMCKCYNAEAYITTVWRRGSFISVKTMLQLQMLNDSTTLWGSQDKRLVHHQAQFLLDFLRDRKPV